MPSAHARTQALSIVEPYRTRFAPSPTGQLHLGHGRTHLLAWLRARSVEGTVAMRIEDLDPPRVRPGSVDAIFRDHEWLGLDWDGEVLYQSARDEAYEAALDVLRGDHRVYSCSCTRKEVAAAASAPHGDEGPRYPGTCRDGPTQRGRPCSERFRLEAPMPFEDGLAGEVPAGLGAGDFVVRRSDGVWAYQLAVVVDDAHQGVTEVVRGDDLLASTPRQLALYEALGLPAPAFVHVPLVLGANGERLAKRHGARPIADYRAAGVTAEALLGVLAHSLGIWPAATPVCAGDLVPAFELSAVASTPITLDAALPALPEVAP